MMSQAKPMSLRHSPRTAPGLLYVRSLRGGSSFPAKEMGKDFSNFLPRKSRFSKEQVQIMLEKTLGVKLDARHLDATDALAIAMCHFYQSTNPLASASSSQGWESFIKNNPDRIK